MFYVRGRKYFVNNVYNIISLLILYLLYIIFIYLYIYIEYIYTYISACISIYQLDINGITIWNPTPNCEIL